MKIKLSEIANYLSSDLNGDDLYINKIVTDSRKIKNGNLFVAISGDNIDGHEYISESIKNGAAAVICEKRKFVSNQSIPYILIKNSIHSLGELAFNYKNKLGNPYTIAVTGTNGKTTVTKLTASILSQSFKVSTTIGNYNNEIGLPLSILESDSNNKIQKSIYELGASKKNDINYLTRICEPNLTTLLNVSEAHLESFGSMKNLIDTKEEIFSHSKTKHVVLNLDDANFNKWKRINSNKKISTVSIKKNADYCLKSSDCNSYNISTIKGDFIIDKNDAQFILPINLLFSVALSMEAGSSIHDVVTGIKKFSGVKGRFYKFISRNKSTVIDDSYNANPESMKLALKQLSLYKNDKIFVMGDMGELGANSYQHHIGIFNIAKDLGVQHLFYMGSFKDDAKIIFGKNCLTFNDITDLTEHINMVSNENTTILIKASRFMNFDIIAKGLK